MTKKHCYMCENEATSVEHVPPKCIFPELKEAGEDHRFNLLTVPSCHTHNCKKSRDDEFLMISIAGIIGNNSIGYHHAKGKARRAVLRSAFKLLDDVFVQNKEIIRVVGESKFVDILWGTPDYDRLVNCFEHIAMGIYYNHFDRRFEGKLKTFMGFIHSNENNPNEFKRMIKVMINRDLSNQDRYGSNQRVFYYQYSQPDEFGLFGVKLCFYENVEVFVVYIPVDSSHPRSLPMEFVNAGVRTIVHQNGDKYEFNK